MTTNQEKLWCAMCGTWGDHQSGTCPELTPMKLDQIVEELGDPELKPMTSKDVGATSEERFEVKDIPPKLQVLSNYVIDQVLGESALEKLPKLEPELSSMREENLRLKEDLKNSRSIYKETEAARQYLVKEIFDAIGYNCIGKSLKEEVQALQADLLLTREVAEALGWLDKQDFRLSKATYGDGYKWHFQLNNTYRVFVGETIIEAVQSAWNEFKKGKA